MIILAKEAQVGDQIILDPANALPGVRETDPLVEDITGVGINLSQKIVDIRTFTRAIFNIPLDRKIEVIRSSEK